MFRKLTLLLCAWFLSCNLSFADGVGTAGPSHFSANSGEELYRTSCQSCHMPSAEGAVGAGYYPALAKNSNLVSSLFLADVIMNGRLGMPPFGGIMDDKQITQLVNYIRSNFGNQYTDKITEKQVSFLRIPDFDYVDMN